MYHKTYLLVLCLLGIHQILAAKGETKHSDGDITFIDEPMMADSPGSGYGSQDDGSGYGAYTDDEDDEEEEGSGPELTQCLRLREDMKGLIGSYIPRCTFEGEFEQLQCHGSTGQCWCVNVMGAKIPDTERKAPERPDCSNVDRYQPVRPERPQAPKNSDDDDRDPPYEIDNTDDIYVANPKNPNGPEVNTLADVETPQDPVMKEKTETRTLSDFLNSPFVLGLIIVGAVVVLLSLILLIMFIVYRMRKKDEGSYPLDEPKRSPSHPYTKPDRKEYFA